MTSTPIRSVEDLRGADLPRLILRDLTGRSHLQFDALDPALRLIHTVVLKERYRLGEPDASGLAPLLLEEAPAPLNDEDLPHEGNPALTIREESDLSPYKPMCDVLVVGSAYAPEATPVASFVARLRVFEPKASAPGATSLEPVAARDAFRVLIDKQVRVHGPRWWMKRPAEGAGADPGAGRRAPRPEDWMLSAAEPIAHCALRYEHGFGGQVRIDVGSPVAGAVPARHHLRPEQLAAHPDASAEPPQRPLAHEASRFNPAGRGFTREWFLQATRLDRLPAHQIELAHQPVTVEDFWHVAAGRESLETVGLGPLERGWAPRVAWIGKETPDPAHVAAGLALNPDFDFRYWNCAPADQQCRPLRGGERVVLDNLWPRAHPAARLVQGGQRMTMFELPDRGFTLMGIDAEGDVRCFDPVIDTVLIDSDEGCIDVCWRWSIGAQYGLEEARLMEARTPGQRERLAELRAVMAQPVM
ncbi:MAG: DUF2169 domain-containing protein [Rubrivivax sp.]|nr:MAG: DUF2169 domain-containing protein [Rubrivivax sp.]